ncbi:AMP-binding protein, partial [Pseudomonas aeruginosa]
DDVSDRTQRLVNDSGIRVVLTLHNVTPAFNGITQIHLERLAPATPTTNPGLYRGTSALAYIMYTSGTSGTPKGVCISHGNIINLALSRHWPETERLTLLVHSTYLFDASTYEIWRPLLAGGILVIAQPGRLTITEISTLIREYRVSHIWLTSGLFDVIAREQPQCLQTLVEVITGGDIVSASSVSAVQKVCPEVIVTNGYGPTETTTFATNGRASNIRPMHTVPVGKPLDNVQIYVLDAHLSPQPVGIVGEVFIAGAGVGLGYFGHPTLTAERFIANPFTPNSRMYRTGDLGKWRSDGMLEVLGRADDQIKLRGYRIELNEIESALQLLPSVKQAKVVVETAPPSGKHLVAYLVPEDEKFIDISTLKLALAGRLPDYMIPARFELLNNIPLTANGKVDRRALPTCSETPQLYQTPRTEDERIIAALYAEVLDREQVSIYDNFFELGGHSLLAVALLSKLEASFNRSLPLRTLFEAPTVAQLANRLRNTTLERNALSVMLALRADGSRSPLFCIHPGGGAGWAYATLLSRLPADVPLYALQSAHLMDTEHEERSIKDMALRYIEEILKVQPSGPFALLGWSLGSLVAHEIAVAMVERGHSIRLLALLDGYPADTQAPATAADSLHTLFSALENAVSQNSMTSTQLDASLREAIEKSYEESGRLIQDHVPKRYAGTTHLFRAVAEQDRSIDTSRWAAYTAELHVYDIDCCHHEMMAPLPATLIATTIEDSL